jgi:hypothetical protein
MALWGIMGKAFYVYGINLSEFVIIPHAASLMLKRKGKDIGGTGRGGPQGSEVSRHPHSCDSELTVGGEVYQPGSSQYSFLLQAE